MKFTKGDTLICISKNAACIDITIGKEYVCISYTNCTDTVLILTDNNIKKHIASTHFKKR